MNNEATLKIDESVKIPKAVRAAAARSQEIFDAVNAANNPDNTDVTPQSNPDLNPLAFTTNPAAQEAPAPQEAPREEGDHQDENDQSWMQKYKSVHGRFLRQKDQIQTLSDQVQNLQNVIATMQAAAPSVQLPDLSAERLITDDEARDYGEDFLKVVGKKAKEELAPVIKAYEAKIKELESKVQGVSGHLAQDSHAKLMDTLDEKMPNWRDLNTNDDFLDWLRLPDPYSGAIRHDMLKAAYAQGNASRVLAFFNGFLAEEAATKPAGNAEPSAKTETVPRVPLQNFAAPGRAKTAAGSNGTPAEKPIFTRAQIAGFYADVAAGKYRGRDADKAKLEGQIFDAQREGRIR